MKLLKKAIPLCLLALVLAICVTLLTPKAQAATEGTCGDNLTWTLDNRGTLTISGTGEMYDYTYNTSPWFNNDNIMTVVVEDGVTSIGEYAFYCSEVRELTLGNDVTTIGNHAFDGGFVSQITFGNSLTTIGADAFTGCNMNVLYFPESLTTIGEYAFALCSNLYRVEIGKNVTEIGRSAFFFCDFVRFWVDENNPAYSADITRGLYNKEGTYLYYGPGGAEEYIAPEGLQVIGENAFYNAYSLSRVVLSDSVTTIEGNAFSECRMLETVILGNNVTNIDSSAFFYSSVSYNIYDNAKYLGTADNPYYALIDSVSDSISAITLHPDTKIIAEEAFHSCSSLEEILLPEGLIAIGKDAFYYCSKLQNLHIPASVTTIATQAYHAPAFWVNENSQAFSSDSTGVLYNKNQTVLLIAPKTIAGHYLVPDSVTEIAPWAFYNHDNLQQLTISEKLTTVGQNAFQSCDGLLEVYYSSTEEAWNGIAFETGNDPLLNATIRYSHVHDYSLLPPVVTATCTEAGYIEYTCIYGETLRVDVDALGHDYSGTVTTVEPTCTQQGYITTQCTRCDSTSEPVYTDALGHNHSIALEVIIPTCYDQGYTIFKCTRCEDTIKDDYTNSLGHNPVVIGVCEPTCTEEGITSPGSMCARCGEIFITPSYTPALGHDFVNGSCSRCQAEDPNFVPGDMDGNNQSDNNDVLALMWHLLYPNLYPLPVSGDVNGDGIITNDDVLRLMWYVLFPEQYPL